MLYFFLFAVFLDRIIVHLSGSISIALVSDNQEVYVGHCVLLDLHILISTYPIQKFSISSKLSFLVMS